MKYLLILLLCFLFSACGSKFELQDNPKVKIDDVYLEKTIGGREETHKKLEIFVQVENPRVELEKIFFREQEKPLLRENRNTWSAVFLILEEPMDIVMSANLLDEYGNKIKKEKAAFPFNLENDEAVISYREGKKLQFFKIEKIREEQTSYLPEKNRENN